MKVGASYTQGRCEFLVWAPKRSRVFLNCLSSNEVFQMRSIGRSYWKVSVDQIRPGTKYMYRFDSGIERPDPASHYQPDGVHGPSMVVDHESFTWRDSDWHGIRVEDAVFYEIHVGTFTREGTFPATLNRLKELSDLGINTVELMPVAQFAGERNWGYDGVFPYAVQNTYGRPDDLKELVNRCHLSGMAVMLDVVFNHVGPEGNCMGDYGPYFLESRRTLWGPAINLDGPMSAQVRDYFIENALYWLRDYHFDGLRIDAAHAIVDTSPKHFLKELSQKVDNYSRTSSRTLHLVAESDLNDPVVVKPRRLCGYGLGAQWLDDFHHSLHALLTGERKGYYVDFGSMQDLVKALSEGYVYSGQYSQYRQKKHGHSSRGVPPSKFVVFSQNHDQIGNRMRGERLITLAGLEAAKLAAGIVILSPYLPLFFMGEEHGEDSPFLFFTSYSDPRIAEAVTIGRRNEFKEFDWRNETLGPQKLEAFRRSKIHWQRRYAGSGRGILGYYKRLIHLRRAIPAMRYPYRKQMKFSVCGDGRLLFIRGQRANSIAVVIANFDRQDCQYVFPFKGGSYFKVLDSADAVWLGSGSSLPDEAVFGDEHAIAPLSMAVFLKPKLGEER